MRIPYSTSTDTLEGVILLIEGEGEMDPFSIFDRSLIDFSLCSFSKASRLYLNKIVDDPIRKGDSRWIE